MNKLAWILRSALAVVAASAALLLGLSFAPTLFGYESFVVTSGSMGRANPVGSVAVTRMVDVRAIKAGDVISFQTESSSRITHRVVAVAEEQGQRMFTTKGDANPFPDPEPLRLASGKVARVEWSVPYAGYLVRYARTPFGGVLLFAVPVLGLILDRHKRLHVTPSLQHVSSSHRGAMSSPLTLSCPHCGEGVTLALLSLGANGQASANPTHVHERQPYEITLPEVTQPGCREWNFPLELPANGSGIGGSRGG